MPDVVRQTLRLITPPASEPVSVAELRDHLRLPASGEDDFLIATIATARLLCEENIGRSFITRSYGLFLDRWPVKADSVDLPCGPVQAVTGVYLYDATGAASTLDASYYAADMQGGRLSLHLAPPAPAQVLSGIEIRYDAGFGVASDVPVIFKQAIRQVAAYLYVNRGDAAVGDALGKSGALALLATQRVRSLT